MDNSYYVVFQCHLVTKRVGNFLKDMPSLLIFNFLWEGNYFGNL